MEIIPSLKELQEIYHLTILKVLLFITHDFNVIRSRIAGVKDCCFYFTVHLFAFYPPTRRSDEVRLHSKGLSNFFE